LKDTKRTGKLHSSEDADARRRWLEIYDNAPSELRPVLVAGMEFVEARYTSKQPRPGANEENLMVLLEALEESRHKGNKKLTALIERWLSRESLMM
jgi:hypothetical protein